MNGRWRWLLLLLLVAPVPAACSPGASSGATGGQGGITLDFGAAGMRDCSPAGEGGAMAAVGGGPASCAGSVSVDFATQVAPILATCQGEVCHNFSDRSTVRAFVDAPSDECCNQRELIAPGHPERSYLVDKLRGRRLCYGGRMPLNRSALAVADLVTLEAWICQGASVP